MMRWEGDFMIYPKPKDKRTENELHRQSYELEKEGLIAFFHEQKYNENNLSIFLVNSLKDMGYEQELREDGLI